MPFSTAFQFPLPDRSPLPSTPQSLTVRVGDARGDGLGDGAGAHELQEVPGSLAVLRSRGAVRHQLGLEGLVDDEVHHGLGDAEVRRGDALVETHEALPKPRQTLQQQSFPHLTPTSFMRRN